MTVIADRRPFVGPVAFREDQGDIFFGRPWEARELVSMVIAHPIVVFYAPSGAGKSSLINAKLIPELRNRGIEVLGPARVKGQLPSETKAPKNIYTYNLISSFRKPSAEDAPPDDLASFLETLPHPVDEVGETLLRVLIIDQLEDLFSFAPECWSQRELFIRQVAAALAQDPLLSVLLVIKEDSLARLDTFATLLPEQLRHRFRLDLLTRDTAEQAIEEPLKRVHRGIDSDALRYLRDELLKVRVRGAGGSTSEMLGEHVEPVQLQVVCDAVWESLPDNVQTITTDHVRAVGDVDGALRRFYERVLVETASESDMTVDELRAWVDEYLITPEGTRGLAYQGKERTGRGERGLPNAAVTRLEEGHLLRAETRSSNERWYELSHDRFIEPILASNQAWKEAKRRSKYFWRAVAVSLVFVVVVVAGVGSYGLLVAMQKEEHARVEGQIDRLLELNKSDANKASDEAEVVLPNVVGYLWQRGYLERMEKQLKRAEGLIGEDFLTDPWIALVMPKRVDKPPLTVEVSSAADLNIGKLQYQWAIQVRKLASSWGIPAPQLAWFRKVDDLPPDRVRVGTSSGARKSLAITYLPPKWWITSGRSTDPRLSEWFEAHRAQWASIGEAKVGGSWWGVPAWTVPLLRVAGAPVSPRETVVVLAVLNKLVEEPDLLLTEENTTLLLRDMRRRIGRVTVDEALAARGGVTQITQDLRALVREQMSLVPLYYLLDSLAHVPAGADAREAAKFALAFYSAQHAPARKRLRPSHSSLVPKLVIKMPQGPYEQTLQWAPLESSQVRVLVTTTLQSYLLDANGKPLVDVLERVEKARGDLYRMRGVAPSIRWGLDEDNRELGFTIHVLDEIPITDAKPSEVLVDPRRAANRLIDQLNARLGAFAGRWLTMEEVNALLSGLPPKSKEWLLQHYSVADLTAILRRLLDEQDGSLRNFNWLLESLVFWAQEDKAQKDHDRFDSTALARALADTQQTSLHPSPAATSEPFVEKGIAALDKGNPDEAARHFKAAIKAVGRRKAVRAAFLAAYAQREAISPINQLKQLMSECGADRITGSDTVSDTTRFTIEEYLVRHKGTLASRDRTSLELCLVKAYVRMRLRHSALSTLNTIASTKTAHLTPDQAYAAGFLLLDVEGFPVERPASADRVYRLLLDAFRRWDEARLAQVAFAALLNRYGEKYSLPRWYLDLLQSLAEQRMDSIFIAERIAFVESNYGRNVEDGAKALKWLNHAEKLAKQFKNETERDIWQAHLRVHRAKAYLLRAYYGDTAMRSAQLNLARHELETLITELRKKGKLTDKTFPGLYAFSTLIRAHRLARNFEGAATTARSGLDAFPENPELKIELIWSQLMPGNIAELLKQSRQWSERKGIPPYLRLRFQFLQATLELLSGASETEVTVRRLLPIHFLRNYLRLMLYWRLSRDGNPRARTYLEETWGNIKPETWEQRLAAGDHQIWRERLIGYYLAKVSEGDLMAPLQSRKTFEKSPYSRMGAEGLSFEGMKCEAYFYSALLHHVTGDPATREQRLRERLQKCEQICPPVENEFLMARYLLSEATGRP